MTDFRPTIKTLFAERFNVSLDKIDIKEEDKTVDGRNLTIVSGSYNGKTQECAIDKDHIDNTIEEVTQPKEEHAND